MQLRVHLRRVWLFFMICGGRSLSTRTRHGNLSQEVRLKKSSKGLDPFGREELNMIRVEQDIVRFVLDVLMCARLSTIPSKILTPSIWLHTRMWAQSCSSYLRKKIGSGPDKYGRWLVQYHDAPKLGGYGVFWATPMLTSSIPGRRLLGYYGNVFGIWGTWHTSRDQGSASDVSGTYPVSRVKYRVGSGTVWQPKLTVWRWKGGSTAGGPTETMVDPILKWHFNYAPKRAILNILCSTV